MISEQAILRKLQQQPRHAAGLKQLVRELGVRGGADRRELEEKLAQMVGRGLLVADAERFALPKAASSKDLVVGRLSMHRDGYGFVIPESAAVKERLRGDIFINPQAIGPAMHGDHVLVEMGPVRDGRAEGRILRVVSRAHSTIVGTFHYGTRYNYIVPIDEKITLDVIIPRGAENPFKTEATEVAREGRKKRPERHRVFGEEVKARRRADWDDLEGVVVDVEITDWPTPTQNPRGRVVEIVGYEDDFGVDVEIIIRKYHLPHLFPAEVLEEAQRIPDTISARELRTRRDYRGLPIVTIDGETARDFDDAVFVRRNSRGDFELQVHIADVAHYVREGTPLDNEARLRGTSVYFPDRAVPMLPVELSTDICSLRPKVDRLVMSCTMEIDHLGEIVGYELNPGIIRSAERMTYTDVNAILEGDVPLRRRYAHIVDGFELMRELATILNRKRVRRGSIDFDLPEPLIEFDEHGMMKTVTRSERNIAHRIIEEFMLAANESVASYLEQKRVGALYRIHEKPDPKKVMEFETLAAAFGYSLGVGALPVKRFTYTDERRPRRGEGTRSGQRRHELEIPEDIHVTPRMYQKLADKIAGKPEERILSYLMLRSLRQARYSEENVGHFALAAPVYTHFTSPIRRYPDLIVHRILKAVLRESAEEEVKLGRADGTQAAEVLIGHGVPAGSETPSPWSKRSSASVPGGGKRVSVSGRDLGRAEKRRKARGASAPEGKPGPIPEPELHEIAEESSDAERRADDAERELMDWKKVKFMADRVGEDFDGLIISVTKFGFFVELTDLFIEGLVPLSSLSDDRYFYNDNTKQIIGQRNRKIFSLGDKVHVLVDRIDAVQKKIQFAVVPPEPSRAQGRQKRS
ncbi:MAG: ribonuclease R family protein [Terriglobales bacterium]